MFSMSPWNCQSAIFCLFMEFSFNCYDWYSNLKIKLISAFNPILFKWPNLLYHQMVSFIQLWILRMIMFIVYSFPEHKCALTTIHSVFRDPPCFLEYAVSDVWRRGATQLIHWESRKNPKCQVSEACCYIYYIFF